MSSDRYDTTFVEPGTLVTPGWIGRLIRLGFGLALLKFFYDLVRYEVLLPQGNTGLTSSQAPDQAWFWLLAFWLFWILPFVVNIGFGVSWRRWPQVAVLVSAAIAIVVSIVSEGTTWSESLGWALLIWLLYESLHLGVSFTLSAVLATPGCEMRAIPHLWALVTGKKTSEHFCPSGFLDSLDRWEAGRRNSREVQT
jgi:hypothetical protein